MTDIDTSICPVDQSDLLVGYDVNEHGILYYFLCRANDHYYRSRWDGFAWIPDFSEVEV